MCGICGFTGLCHDNKKVISKMMDRIIHRGPDSFGSHISDDITLGFRRLSFIDLQDGGQPIYNEDNTLVIVFNGEIYNYKELRAELVSQGHIFKTHTDTETLIHSYEEYGVNMLERLRGMFAFAIYDTVKKELFAARDFFGIKPFYYTIADGQFLFGSEIKSFLEHPNFKKELNEEALSQYLSFQYSVLDETFFKGVYKLKPAHYLIFKGGQLKTERYFEPVFKPDDNKELSDAVSEIDAVVRDSIEKHKISDVPVGSFLSSGVDSSYVAACFNGAKTFTVGFDYDTYNEISYAKDLSAHIDIENFSKTITTEEYWGSLPKIQYHMDEPLADPSAVALYFVSKLAREHVKGALSGEGADEFFGGYNIYKEPLSLRIFSYMPKPLRKFLGHIAKTIPFSFKGKNFFIRGSKTIEQRFIGNANIFGDKEKNNILKRPLGTKTSDVTKPVYDMACNCDDITKMQYIDMNLWLVGDILLKADKMSMANSLEVRVPFLDKEVFKIASSVPVKYRVNRSSTKYAFRLAAKKHLPQKVSEKKKLGFPVPIRIWLREDKYYNVVKEAFTSEAAEKYFNEDSIVKMLDLHKSGKKDLSRKIWVIYTFLVWYKQYFENELNLKEC